MLQHIDYQKLYADVTNKKFIKTLQLRFGYDKLLPLLYEQRQQDDAFNPGNPLYIPNLQIEGLVHDGNTPYQAMRGLHELNRRKIITYGIAERIPPEQGPEMIEDMLFTPLIEQAMEDGLVEEPQPQQEYRTNDTYRRVAMFNLEYPVVYFCLQEEKGLSKVVEGVLQEFYDAIYAGRLPEALEERDYPMILEFLNFMQTMFQQPLTEKVYEQEQTNLAEVSSGGRLVTGVEPDRTWPEIQQTPVHGMQVVPEQGVEGGSGGQDEAEEEGAGGGEQRGFARIDEIDLTKVGYPRETVY